MLSEQGSECRALIHHLFWCLHLKSLFPERYICIFMEEKKNLITWSSSCCVSSNVRGSRLEIVQPRTEVKLLVSFILLLSIISRCFCQQLEITFFYFVLSLTKKIRIFFAYSKCCKETSYSLIDWLIGFLQKYILYELVFNHTDEGE